MSTFRKAAAGAAGATLGVLGTYMALWVAGDVVTDALEERAERKDTQRRQEAADAAASVPPVIPTPRGVTRPECECPAVEPPRSVDADADLEREVLALDRASSRRWMWFHLFTAALFLVGFIASTVAGINLGNVPVDLTDPHHVAIAAGMTLNGLAMFFSLTQAIDAWIAS